MKNAKKIIIPIAIIVVLVLVLCPTLFKMLSRKIQRLEYRMPIEVMGSEVGADISYYDIGITGAYEDDYYEFDNCKLRIEYFEEDVTKNSELNLVKDKSKTINGHKWYYSNNEYFTNYKGNTYVVRITNNDSCNKINNKVIKSLKLK